MKIVFFGMFPDRKILTGANLEWLALERGMVVTAYLVDEARFVELVTERSEDTIHSSDPRFHWLVSGALRSIPYSTTIDEREGYDEIVVHREDGTIALRYRKGKRDPVGWAIHYALVTACKVDHEEKKVETPKGAAPWENPIKRAFAESILGGKPPSPPTATPGE